MTKSLQMSEDTNNPVYKLITDKLQLVLINVLITTFFEERTAFENVHNVWPNRI